MKAFAPLLDVRSLSVAFSGKHKRLRQVVDNFSFFIGDRETLAIVGESGCGKSVSALSVLRLLPDAARITAGKILFEGQDLLSLSAHDMDAVRGAKIGMVFQDALTSLNPVFTVGNQLTEAIRTHSNISRTEAKLEAQNLLREVGIADPVHAMKRYAFMLSGGQRQRVMIAMALAQHPKLLIADEATTALDVTVQAQILSLMNRMQQERGMSLLLITHDIGLVAQNADRVIVMYAGQAVEEADVYSLFDNPLHPYSKALIGASPDMSASGNRRLSSIKGHVPADYGSMTGCRFYDRCPYADQRCKQRPEMITINATRRVRCVRATEIDGLRKHKAAV